MKKSVIAAAVVIALVGLGVAAVPLAEKVLASRIKSEIERDGATQVSVVEVGLFGRRIALVDVKSTRDADRQVGRWEAFGLDWPLSELLQGRTPLAGFQWGDPLQAERLELHDVRMTDRASGAKWSFGSLSIEGLDIARYDANVAGPNRFTVLVARLMGALSMRRLEERSAVFAVAGSGDTVGAAGAVIDGYDRGKIGALKLTAIEATPKQASAPIFSIADIDVKGLDLRRPVAVLSSGTWRPGAPMGRLNVEQAHATGFGGEAFTRYGLSLGGIAIETVRASPQVVRSRSRIDGFVLAPPLRGLESLQLRVALQSMGLKELRLGVDCAGSEDRTKSELTIKRCALTGPDLGEIVLSGTFVQADEAFWQAVDEGDITALDRTKVALASAKLVLADKTLLERSLKALAAANAQPAAAMRANLAQQIRHYQPAGVLITEDLTKLLDTVARFIEQGGTLTIDAQPEPPFGLAKAASLRSPGPDLVSLLGLSATLSR